MSLVCPKSSFWHSFPHSHLMIPRLEIVNTVAPCKPLTRSVPLVTIVCPCPLLGGNHAAMLNTSLEFHEKWLYNSWSCLKGLYTISRFLISTFR